MLILHEKQKEVVSSNARFRVVLAGRRSGKTQLSLVEMLGTAMSQADRKVVYIAPTIPQARDICWEQLKKMSRQKIISTNEARLEIELKANGGGGSAITLRSFESIETLRGLSFDLIVLDEVASMRNFFNNWIEVLRPTLTDREGRALFISTPKGFNHFYELYNRESLDKNYKSFKFTSYDNPYISKDEIDQARQEMPEDRFAQEYLADFRKTEGLVYKEFDREKHLFSDCVELPTFVETMIGVDFGYTAPSCILHICKDTHGNYWVIDEFYQSKITNQQLTEKAKSYNANLCYADPEAPEKIAEFEKAGIYCRQVIKGRDSVTTGINRVREMFLQNRIKISFKCKNLILELETYRYPDFHPGKNPSELPVGDMDHAVSALRYALMTNDPIVYKDSDYEDYKLYTTNYL